MVDAGHHNRKFMRLTGMDVGEHQAARLLADIDVWRATNGLQDLPLEQAAHEWLTDVFAPVVRAIPRELAASWSPRSSTTSISSTAGTWPSRSATMCRATRL